MKALVIGVLLLACAWPLACLASGMSNVWKVGLGLMLLLVGSALDCAETPATTTTTTSARIERTARPVLPLLVLRTARTDLGLAGHPAEIVDWLIEETETASKPIDRARGAFVESLSSSVERGELDEPGLAVLAEHLVAATERATPVLRRMIVRLYTRLTLVQRIELAEAVKARMAEWAPTWLTNEALRSWILDPGAYSMVDFERDVVQTARLWTERSLGEARAAVESGVGRHALAVRLRAGE